jgi:hypothetical protein
MARALGEDVRVGYLGIWGGGGHSEDAGWESEKGEGGLYILGVRGGVGNIICPIYCKQLVVLSLLLSFQALHTTGTTMTSNALFL